MSGCPLHLCARRSRVVPGWASDGIMWRSLICGKVDLEATVFTAGPLRVYEERGGIIVVVGVTAVAAAVVGWLLNVSDTY